MAVKTVDSNQARNNWRETLDTVLVDDTDVVITRYNKPVVTVLPYEDYLSIREELAKYRSERKVQRQLQSESLATMIASERVLGQEWNTTEEDEAWADL